MREVCQECGAPLPESGSCRDLFHALLMLEYEVPGGPGDVAHFLAVSSYVLQHPEGMRYTAEALQGSRGIVADQLSGRATLDEIRRRVRHAVNGSRRVMRRPGEPAPRWSVAAWPISIADVLAGGTEGYASRVDAWARSILRTLDEAEAIPA